LVFSSRRFASHRSRRRRRYLTAHDVCANEHGRKYDLPLRRNNNLVWVYPVAIIISYIMHYTDTADLNIIIILLLRIRFRLSRVPDILLGR
jgi:hypothetical protein